MVIRYGATSIRYVTTGIRYVCMYGDAVGRGLRPSGAAPSTAACSTIRYLSTARSIAPYMTQTQTQTSTRTQRHRHRQYRAQHSTIPELSTAHSIAQYASSVPCTA
eukprot:2254740-Rhodomonas_salina.1